MFYPLTRIFITSFLTLTLLAATSSAYSADKTLVFSAIPDQDQSQLIKRFSKVADYLSKTLGIPVKYVPVKS